MQDSRGRLRIGLMLAHTRANGLREVIDDPTSSNTQAQKATSDLLVGPLEIVYLDQNPNPDRHCLYENLTRRMCYFAQAHYHFGYSLRQSVSVCKAGQEMLLERKETCD